MKACVGALSSTTGYTGAYVGVCRGMKGYADGVSACHAT